jgi:FkbM family methyltransferase
MIEFRARQLLGFARAFGIGPGVRLWASMKWQLLRGDSLQLEVPGLEAALTLRRQDLPIFDQVLVEQQDDIHPYAQAGGVEETYRRLLAEGKRPVILDCGGHVGLSAIWFASRFPQATVYSLEPEARNFRLLQKNAAPYLNIIPLYGGIWSHACELEIINPEAVSAAFQVREVQQPGDALNPIRGYTVDEVLQNAEDNHLLLIKVDVEGAEAELFREASASLAEATAVVIELHDWLFPGSGSSRNFFRWAATYDFEMVQRGENLVLFKSQTQGVGLEPELSDVGTRELP